MSYTIKTVSHEDPEKEVVICGSPYFCKVGADGNPIFPGVEDMYDGMLCYTDTALYICHNFTLHPVCFIGSIEILPDSVGGNSADYLLCDGSTFDIGKYPLLYKVLSSNTLPELSLEIIGYSYYIRVNR